MRMHPYSGRLSATKIQSLKSPGGLNGITPTGQLVMSMASYCLDSPAFSTRNRVAFGKARPSSPASRVDPTVWTHDATSLGFRALTLPAISMHAHLLSPPRPGFHAFPPNCLASGRLFDTSRQQGVNPDSQRRCLMR